MLLLFSYFSKENGQKRLRVSCFSCNFPENVVCVVRNIIGVYKKILRNVNRIIFMYECAKNSLRYLTVKIFFKLPLKNLEYAQIIKT